MVTAEDINILYIQNSMSILVIAQGCNKSVIGVMEKESVRNGDRIESGL